MKDLFDLKDSTTTTIPKVSFIDFIVANGFYPSFLKFCSAYPSIKSRKRLAIMFLKSRYVNPGVYRIARCCVLTRCNLPMSRFKEVSAYEMS